MKLPDDLHPATAVALTLFAQALGEKLADAQHRGSFDRILQQTNRGLNAQVSALQDEIDKLHEQMQANAWKVMGRELRNYLRSRQRKRS